jgi:NAD(P)H-hydrate epimerase
VNIETNMNEIPSITKQQMIEVDRLMVDEYGISLLQMMENAGRGLAELCRRLLGGSVDGKRVAVFCGGGNNGGGGMCAARHLHNWGAEILLKVSADQQRLKEAPSHQYQILKAMGISDRGDIDLDKCDMVIDAMIGYGLSGDPSGSSAFWIERINHSRLQVLALDTPSGLDTTTGIPGNPCMHASATLTLALPKSGLIKPGVQPYIGDLYLADIGVPLQLYSRLGIDLSNPFIHDTIVKI